MQESDTTIAELEGPALKKMLERLVLRRVQAFKEWSEINDISQSELATLLKVSPGTVATWIKGTRIPSHRAVVKKLNPFQRKHPKIREVFLWECVQDLELL